MAWTGLSSACRTGLGWAQLNMGRARPGQVFQNGNRPGRTRPLVKTQDWQKLSNLDLVSILSTVNIILNKTGDKQYAECSHTGNCMISGSTAPTLRSIMLSSWNLLRRLLVLRCVHLADLITV